MSEILTPQQIANFAVNRHPDSINTQERRDVLRGTLKKFNDDLLKGFAERLG